MNDLFTARSQLAITLLWMTGFFGLLIAEGLKLVVDVPNESLFAMTGVILYFWFNRQRNQENPKTADIEVKKVSKEEKTP